MTTAQQLQHRAFLLWEQAKDHTTHMRYEAAADLRSEAFEMALLAEEQCAPNNEFVKRQDVRRFYEGVVGAAVATKKLKRKFCRTK